MLARTIDKLLTVENLGVLFKPVQVIILEKLKHGHPLTENEKRYLRGHLGKKLEILERLMVDRGPSEGSLPELLDNIGDYYITGYAALKNNGFGWYYDLRRIDVINKRIDGRMRFKGKIIIFHRVKSIDRKAWRAEPGTGLRYARNEQVLKDARRARRRDIVGAWISLFERYRGLFVRRPKDFLHLIAEGKSLRPPEQYGVR
jgi:hypothetical protein